MAAAALLGSLARKMARAPPRQLGPHGQGRGDQFAAAAGLPSWATKLAHHRLLHQRGLGSLNSGASAASTPPTTKSGLATKLAKIGAGVIAYVALFGSLAHLYGSLLPWLESLEAKWVAARNMLNVDDDAVDIQALRILLAVDVGPDAQNMQSSGVTLKEVEAKIKKLEQLAFEEAGKGKGKE